MAAQVLDPQAVPPAVALEALRLDYRRKVELLAQRLHEVAIDDVRPGDVCEVGQRFEEKVARPLVAPTVEASLLVLALSSHAEDAGDPFDYQDPRDAGALAATLDAADLCGARWFLDLYLKQAAAA